MAKLLSGIEPPSELNHYFHPIILKSKIFTRISICQVRFDLEKDENKNEKLKEMEDDTCRERKREKNLVRN